MPAIQQFSRIDILEIKTQILKKLGREKADQYFVHLRRFLGLHINKAKFNKLCCSLIGRENIALHNLFIRSILQNACLSHIPPTKQTNTVHSRNSKISSGHLSEVILPSPRKERSVNSRYRKFRDRPSPLGPYGKVQPEAVPERSNSCDLQRPQELISIGSKAFVEVGSVEDGEEVEQVRGSPGVQSRSPVRAPLGISVSSSSVSHKQSLTRIRYGFQAPPPNIQESCHDCGELPDAIALKKRLEHKLLSQGLGLSVDCVDLLNNGLDSFLKLLIKPCVELARERCNGSLSNQIDNRIAPGVSGARRSGIEQRPFQTVNASLDDFRVAMELNPELLNNNLAMHIKKAYLMEE